MTLILTYSNLKICLGHPAQALACAYVVATCFLGAAARSGAAEVPADRIEEVIVYGTKQALGLQEVEVSVEVFDVERIDQESLFDLDDLLLRTPNVQSLGTTANFSIRGISRFGVGSAGQGVTSNVYLDGAPIASIALSYGFDSLWDLAQVEVLRGPQSTVQGRNALAGAVVMRTTDPSFDWEARARLRAAEFDTQQYAAVVSGAILEDQLAFRLSADYQTTDGFVTNGFTGRNDNVRENTLLRAKLLWTPESERDLRAKLTIDYNESTIGPQSNRVFSNFAADDPRFLSDFDFNDYESFIPQELSDNTTLRAIADLSFDLSPSLRFQGLLTFEGNELDRVLGDPDNPGSIDSVVNEDVINDQDIYTYSAELRLEFDRDRWSGSLGAYAFRDSNELDTQFFAPLAREVFFPIDPITTSLVGTSFTETTTDNYAVYAQVRFDLNERWSFDASLRYDEETYATDSIDPVPTVDPADCSATIPDFLRDLLGVSSNIVSCVDLVGFATQEVDNPDQEDTFSALLPRAAITYNVHDNLAMFASAQRGYRAGGTFLQLTTAGQVVRAYDPEFLTNFELGWRSQWMDSRFTLNGNLFYSILEDQQLTIPGPSGGFTDSEIVNAGESILYGLELSTDFLITDGLSVYGSIGLLRATFEDFPFAAPGQPFDNLSGNNLPAAPRISASVGTNYRHSSGFFASASFSYSGEQDSGVTNFDEGDLGPGLTERVGSRTLLNARVGFDFGRLMLQAYATNLLDEDELALRLLANVGPDTGSIVFRPAPLGEVLQPRAFGVGVDFAL